MPHLNSAALKVTTTLTIGEAGDLPSGYTFSGGAVPTEEQYISLQVTTIAEKGALIAGDAINGHDVETTGGEATGGETGGSSEDEVVS